MDLTKDDVITIDLSTLTTSTTGTWTIDANTMPNVYISDSTSPYAFNDLTIGTIDTTLPLNGKNSLSLTGEDADITINGESLMTMIRGIQDRLNILAPDPAMEQEWEELATIRKMYDRKLAECRAKSKVWNTLKSMPPPETE